MVDRAGVSVVDGGLERLSGQLDCRQRLQPGRGLWPQPGRLLSQPQIASVPWQAQTGSPNGSTRRATSAGHATATDRFFRLLAAHFLKEPDGTYTRRKPANAHESPAHSLIETCLACPRLQLAGAGSIYAVPASRHGCLIVGLYSPHRPGQGLPWPPANGRRECKGPSGACVGGSLASRSPGSSRPRRDDSC